MIVFADSSAVVALYAPAEANVLPAGAAIVVSALARVEVVSALWRKAEMGDLTSAEVARLVRGFEADCTSAQFHFIQLDAGVLTRAADLSGSLGLRSLDAIQLSCAVAARAAEPECRTIVALDDRLRRAAARERFELLPHSVTR